MSNKLEPYWLVVSAMLNVRADSCRCAVRYLEIRSWEPYIAEDASRGVSVGEGEHVWPGADVRRPCSLKHASQSLFSLRFPRHMFTVSCWLNKGCSAGRIVGLIDFDRDFAVLNVSRLMRR